MKIATDFHVFRSHFFSKLEEFGPNAILSWSKNMNIFERSVIFIPVNESNHWTLLAVVNCGSIISEDKTLRKDATSAIYNFDSCRGSCAESKRRASLIYGWLNAAEMEMRGGNKKRYSFNPDTLPLYSPRGKYYIEVGYFLIVPLSNLIFA